MHVAIAKHQQGIVMHSSDAYHMQGIRDFTVVNTKYIGGNSIVTLAPKPNREALCPSCATRNAILHNTGEVRKIVGLPVGPHKTFFKVPVYRVACLECGASCREPISFCSRYARHSKALERSVIELRREMSIKAVANFVNLDWRAVKDIEKDNLRMKYRRIALKNVRIIGIDEIYVGRSKYKTIVRDLESGAVLFVGEGKGGDALKPFAKRIRSSRKCKIEVVAMDMSSGYAAWVKNELKTAVIVFDHFHVIQLMNKKLDELRRRTIAELSEEEKKLLKSKRFLLLKGLEKLNAEEVNELEKLKATFEDLSLVHAMKERLRCIYRIAENQYDARILFEQWIIDARSSGIACLKTMAKTLSRLLEGVLGYWKYNQLTSAGMEGFNNKIRWLIRQAYGFRDPEYFKLKIFDLPTCSIVKKI